MDMYELITYRHSVRNYTKEEVSEEDIKKIIEAGLSAPSGQNTQPWHFTIIQNKNVQNKLIVNAKNKFLEFGAEWRKQWANKGNFNPFYDPSVIIVVSRKIQVANSNEDCCFAIQNMILMAESLGLSSCIIRDICWVIDKSNQSKYGIPQDYECFLCVSIGYAERKNSNKKVFDYSKVNFIK